MAAVRFDDLLVRLGEFGKYQRCVFLAMCAVFAFAGVLNFSSIFTTYIPKHRCKIPGIENDTYDAQSADHIRAIDAAIPKANDVSIATRSMSIATAYSNVTVTKDSGWSECHIWAGNGTMEMCNEWVYDTTVFTSTIVSQFDLVCERKSWRTHIRMVYMAGYMVGALVFGPLSDRFGRKAILLVAIALLFSSSTILTVSTDVFMFAFLYFLSGAAGNGSVICSYGLMMEMIGVSKRYHAGVGGSYFYVVGLMSCVLYSYFLRNWIHLQLAMALPGVFFIFYYWFIPESPRWLLSNNQGSRATDVIMRMAQVNKSDVDETVLKRVEDQQEVAQVQIWHIFRYRSLTITFVIVVVNWVTCACLYYGLSLNSGNFVGNIHLNVFISFFVDLIANVLCHVWLNRIGRKVSYIVSVMAGGVACFLTIFPMLYLSEEHQWLTITLASIGKLGLSCAFTIMYVYTVELFPTVVRMSVFASASMIARVGSIVSPYIADLGLLMGGDTGRVMPLVIFSTVAILSGVISFKLPRTLNQRMPETLDDFHNLKRDTYRNAVDQEQNGVDVVSDVRPMVDVIA